MKNVRILVAAAVVATALTAATPAAHAWPKPPYGKHLSPTRVVPQKHLSFSLRVVARRVMGRQVSVPRVLVGINPMYPESIAWGYKIGKLWCVLANTRPGSALTTGLSMVAAARFCRKHGRGWAYTHWYIRR